MKVSLWAIPLLGIGLILAVNILFLTLAEAMVAKGYWLESKVSKGMLLQKQNPVPEIVFIGSSRTQNHISSQYFSSHGHEAFNYGVAGNLLWDYPHMIEMAKRSGGKVIVISLPAEFLFESPQCPQFTTWLDLNFVMGNTPDCLMKEPFRQWASSLPINRTLPEPGVMENYYPCTTVAGRAIIAKQLTPLDAATACADEKNLLLIRGDEKRSVIVFKNGDGLIFSTPNLDLKNQLEWINRTNTPFNPAVIRYLKNLVLPLQLQGKKPIFVIEASPLKHILINKSLEMQTGVRTLYMNDQDFDFSEVADAAHFNAKGNKHITEWLYQHLF